MKKISLILAIILLLTSCFTRVNIEKKGSINLAINWPKTEISSNINKNIKSETTKITVKIYPLGTPALYQEETIYHTDESSHSVEFKNLAEGKWFVSIMCYDTTVSDIAPISFYGDIIEVTANEATEVSTNFGSPRKVLEPSQYSVSDGAIGVESCWLAIDNLGSTHINDTTNSSVYVTFYLSTDVAFTSPVAISYPYSSVPQLVLEGNEAGVGTFGLIDSTFLLEPNTTYYWEAVLTNAVGSTTSSTFTFTTTGSPIIP